MDSTDRQLLSLLRDNARLSVASLAKSLRVARGTVQNRLARKFFHRNRICARKNLRRRAAYSAFLSGLASCKNYASGHAFHVPFPWPANRFVKIIQIEN